MRKIKFIFALSGLFLLASIAAFGFEEYYRVLVRQIFELTNNDRFLFTGKNFHLFPSYLFCYGFGLFVVFLFILTYRQSKELIVQTLALTVVTFFAATIITSLIDSKIRIQSCTTCQDGQTQLNYNAINYDAHFMIGLTVALAFSFMTLTNKKVDDESLPTTRVLQNTGDRTPP